jgi:signal transduction histidine kinase
MSGSGLGLSIVLDLATLYAGNITLDECHPSGLRAILCVPIA